MSRRTFSLLIVATALGYASLVFPSVLGLDARLPRTGVFAMGTWGVMLLLFLSGFLMGFLDAKRFHLWGIVLLMAPAAYVASRIAGPSPSAFLFAGLIGLPAWVGSWLGAWAGRKRLQA